MSSKLFVCSVGESVLLVMSWKQRGRSWISELLNQSHNNNDYKTI